MWMGRVRERRRETKEKNCENKLEKQRNENKMEEGRGQRGVRRKEKKMEEEKEYTKRRTRSSWTRKLYRHPRPSPSSIHSPRSPLAPQHLASTSEETRRNLHAVDPVVVGWSSTFAVPPLAATSTLLGTLYSCLFASFHLLFHFLHFL